MNSFIEKINYSSSNEDSNSELKALCINQEDSILCITGSGARPLDLLIKGPKEIVSIDFNLCQNFLLELKVAAIRCLEYNEFLEFMGVCVSQKREITYKAINKYLSTDAKNFWNNNIKIIKKGVIYQGRWEKYFKKLAQLVSITHSKLRDSLFACSNIVEQTRIWYNNWDNFLWRIFFICISSRKVWKYFFGDPGFYEHVPLGFSISDYLNKRFNSTSENVLFSKSPFLTLLFWGKYFTEVALPLYLCKENYATIKENLPNIQITTQSLLEYLEQSEKNRFNKYSLSDFSSYTSNKEYTKIWKGIVRTASHGAVICERQFLVKRQLPIDVMPFIIRDTALEEELSRTDDSCFYTFIIGKIDERNKPT